MKIYLSHPITGLEPHEFFPLFAEWDERLTDEGFEVVNPTTLPGHQYHDQSWASFMLVDLQALKQCDAMVYLCPEEKWSKSDGCLIEGIWSKRLGIHMFESTECPTFQKIRAIRAADDLEHKVSEGISMKREEISVKKAALMQFLAGA